MVWLQCTGLASVTTYILRVKNPRPLLRCGLLPNYLGQFSLLTGYYTDKFNKTSCLTGTTQL